MAVAPASLADTIIVLDGDDDDDESLNASCSISTSFIQPEAKAVFQPKVQQPVPPHFAHSPFASARKDAHVLQAENERLFGEVSLVIVKTIRVFNIVKDVFVLLPVKCTSIFLFLPSLWITVWLTPRTARRFWTT